MCSWTIGIKNASLVIDIPSIEKLVELISGLATVGHVSPHCVQVTNPLGEADMAGIVQASISEH